MTIAFIHPHKSFLPELDAYNHFFSAYQWNCIIVDPSKPSIVRADVEWRIMGSYSRMRRIAPLLIHEYSSASTPPFSRLKDFFKSCEEQNPDFRIFLNDWVKKQYAFPAECPFGFRDMGVSPLTEKWHPGNKEFDFIYVGNMDPNRKPERLLQIFATGTMSNRSILMLGRNHECLQRKFSKNQNIIFRGPVSHAEVNSWLTKSSYAINYVPGHSPYIFQTSTKLLEYANQGMPIISSDYPWVREFQKAYGGHYFFMDPDLGNLSWKRIREFSYSQPDLSSWTWERQIRNSGVLEFLETNLKGINFKPIR